MKHEMPQILILTGPPGSGKTTVSKILGHRLGQSVHLHSDDFWRYVVDAIPPWLSESHHQNGVVMQAICATAGAFAAGGYFVIVDGIIGPWFIHHFGELGERAAYIVLQPSLEESIERCSSRDGAELSEPSVIEQLHREFSKPDGFADHKIQTEGLSPMEVADLVESLLTDPRFRLMRAS